MLRSPCAHGSCHIKGGWTIVNLGSRQIWVFSFMILPLYPQGKKIWYCLNRVSVGPRTIPDMVNRISQHSYWDSKSGCVICSQWRWLSSGMLCRVVW
jgi:hypothetical protein